MKACFLGMDCGYLGVIGGKLWTTLLVVPRLSTGRPPISQIHPLSIDRLLGPPPAKTRVTHRIHNPYYKPQTVLSRKIVDPPTFGLDERAGPGRPVGWGKLEHSNRCSTNKCSNFFLILQEPIGRRLLRPEGSGAHCLLPAVKNSGDGGAASSGLGGGELGGWGRCRWGARWPGPCARELGG